MLHSRPHHWLPERDSAMRSLSFLIYKLGMTIVPSSRDDWGTGSEVNRALGTVPGTSLCSEYTSRSHYPGRVLRLVTGML